MGKVIWLPDKGLCKISSTLKISVMQMLLKHGENRTSEFDRLEQEILCHPTDVGTIDQFYREAVAQNQVDSARNTIYKLQRQFPQNRKLREIYIAFCLYQQDYHCAMESIEALVAMSVPENGLIDAAIKVRDKIGPLRVGKKCTSESTLSVCMIVKDEQNYLGPCLQSIKMLADEIVVVDTGSCDRTTDIALIFGAKVFHYEWIDDFAAARNYSIDKATGDWILVMDADEAISRKDKERFLHFCRQLPKNERLSYTLTTLNYTDQRESAGWVKDQNGYPEAQAEGWVPTTKVRLFPNHHKIRFVYPVHEVVDPVLVENGYRVKRCSIPVLHFGKLDCDRRRQRGNMYYRIGRKKLSGLGEQSTALRELAIQAALLNRLDEASDLWERYLRQCPGSINGLTNLASIYSRLGRYRQAAKAAHKAAELAPEKKEPLYNLVISDLQNGDADSAVKNSKRLMGRFPEYAQGIVLAAITLLCSGKKEEGIEMLKIVRSKVGDRAYIQLIAETTAPIRNAGQHRWMKGINHAIAHAT
jgi:glycosyltransferase involved in cell wall biosynthesis